MKHTRESIVALIDECRATEKSINLKGIDLSGLDLSGLDLRWADLRLANLQSAILQKTDLRLANLQGANLRGANMRWANLRWSDLRWANLQSANMRWADMQGANLDFAGYELSCNTIGIKVDTRMVSQLLYHLCRMNVANCPEWDELRNDGRIIDLANKSHVIDDYDMPEIKQTKEEEG